MLLCKSFIYLYLETTTGTAMLEPRAPGSMRDDDSKRGSGRYTKKGQDLDPEMPVVNNRGLTMPTTAPPTTPQKIPPPSQPPQPDRSRDHRSRGECHRSR